MGKSRLKMTNKEAIKVIENEKLCVVTRDKGYCNGGTDCSTCNLVKPTYYIIDGFDKAIESLSEHTLTWTKPLADSTLMRMTKSELIDYVRLCEKNVENAMGIVDQQAKNVEKLLKESDRKNGHWIGDFGNSEYNDWHCSNCRMYYPERNKKLLGDYCPWCGADMRGEEEWEEKTTGEARDEYVRRTIVI